MTLRVEEAVVQDTDLSDIAEKVQAQNARISKLEGVVELQQQIIRQQQAAVLGALNTLQQFADLRGVVDAQGIQMVDALETLAQRLGVHDFAHELGIAYRRVS